MTAATPGPWSIQRNYNSINGAHIVTESGLWICSISRIADKPIDQKEADAALIKAAPRLLAALIRSEEGWRNAIEIGLIPPQHINAARILADEAAAAIAEATGL